MEVNDCLTRNGALLTRRRFLATAASSAAMMATGSIAKPYLNRAGGRPVITHGVQSGDISINSVCRVGARGSARPDAGRGLDNGQLRRRFGSTVFVDAMPEVGFHCKGAARRSPRRAGTSSTASRSRTIRRRPSSASRRLGISAPHRATSARCRFSGPGDTRRPRMGNR